MTSMNASAVLEPRPTSPQPEAVKRHPLANIFKPRNVALVGASERVGSVGAAILRNMQTPQFEGRLFGVNPKRSSVLGVPSFPSLKEIPVPIDVAIIATPAPTIADVIRDCVSVGIPGAVIISAGFRERGAAGLAEEEEIVRIARNHVRIIGPNCLGVMSPAEGLNATFAADIALPGSVAFLSQSGALCTAILDWSLSEMVGFSAFVSTGSMADVGWGDLIDYFGDDPATRSIVVYMESIGDARAFLSAAREVALTKPIILIKVGRNEAAARAAASHTGAMTGSDEVLDAAFRRCGVLRVNTVAELFYMTEVLSKQPRPRGRRLMIVSNAGGPGVLATDRLISEGGELAPLAPETLAKLNEFLPEHWSHNNPIDILGDAGPDRYARAFQLAADDPNCDGLLALTSPQGMTQAEVMAEAIIKCDRKGKPLLTSWMGGEKVAEAIRVFNKAGVPTFPYPDTAAAAFVNMCRLEENLRMLYETPALASAGEVCREAADVVVRDALAQGRTLLTEVEAKRLLAAYGIPVVETRTARSLDEAVAAADALGYPVVLKLWSTTITHKTDVGGVKLNLRNATAVREAYRSIREGVVHKAKPTDFLGVTVQPMLEPGGYELIVGSTLDPQLGPVVLFGAGGQLVEVFHDHAVGLPPLNRTLAKRLLERTKIYIALQGVRGRRPVNIAALESLLVRFSQLIVEQPWIRELEINPLLASADRLVGLDARAVLHAPGTPPEQLSHPVIRPYPTQYIASLALKDGAAVTIRPIRPEDEPLMVHFHESLSERTAYLRYFQVLQLARRVAHERLARMCFLDYDRQMALVAEHQNPETGSLEIIGVGRLSRVPSGDAEIALVISDPWQRHGLGLELAQRLVQIARDQGVRRVSATYLAENLGMRNIARKLGMRVTSEVAEPTISAVLEIA